MRKAFLPLLFVIWGCAEANGPQIPEVVSYPVRSCETTLTYSQAASVAGDFTDWESVELMETDGQWSWKGVLAPGTYAYRFEINGSPETTPEDVLTRWQDGAEVRALEVTDCELPAWDFEEIRSESGTIYAKAVFQSGAKTREKLDVSSVKVTAGGQDVPASSVTVNAENGEVVVQYIPAEPGKYSLRISGTDRAGVAAENNNAWLPVWAEEKPFKWQDGVMYLAFTDRFRAARGMRPEKPTNELAEIASFMGGDFAGVTEAIRDGYFTEMGVNILWLSPVYENPTGAYTGVTGDLFTGYHGYWPIDPLATETNYGGDEDLHELIQAAHDAGIRVLFDIVLNHVHEDHVYCDENPSWCETTCVCGTQGCGWDDRPLDCQFAPYLPDLNYRNADLHDRVLEDVLGLMEKFDVDGLRIDAAKHMDHVIMRSLRQQLNAREESGIAPFYLVGETFTGDRGLIMNYVADYELHGQFDFPLYYAIRGAFASGNQGFLALEQAAAAGQRAYGKYYTWMSPFLGNHDIPRFTTEAAGNGQGSFGSTPDLMAAGPADTITEWNLINRASMAFAFVLTQPGVPLIYYGDEVGLAGDQDPDNRRFMPDVLNANQKELLRRVQELGQARQQIPALRGSERKELWVDESAYVYVRSEGNQVAIVAMNRGDSTRTLDVTVPSAYGLSGKTMRVWNRDGLESTIVDGKIRIELNSWEYRIMVPVTE